MKNSMDNYNILFSNLLYESVKQKKINSAFILYDDPAPATEILNEFLEGKETEYHVLPFKAESEISSPYFPFLNLIRDALKGENRSDVERHINENVYVPLRDLFLSYISSADPFRDEELIVEELKFEKKKMEESIIRLFGSIHEGKNVILVIDSVCRFPVSTLELLRYLNSSSLSYPLLCIVCHSRHDISSFSVSAQQEDLVANLEKEMHIVDLRVHSLLSINENSQCEDSSAPQSEMLRQIKKCIAFNAFDDAYSIARKIISGLASPADSGKDAGELSLVAGELFYYLKKYDLAILQLQHAVSIALNDSDYVMLQRAYMRMSQVYYHKNNLDSAEKFAQLSLKFAEQIGDLRTLFYALSTLLIIDDKENRMSRDVWISTFDEIVLLAEKLGYMNTLAFWLVRHDRFDPNVSSVEIEKMIDRGIQLCRNIGNDMRLAAAYHAKGLFYIFKNEYEKVTYYYKKSEKLTEATDNPVTMSQICNGFGFFYLQNGKNAEAARYFSRAFDYSYISREFHEIAMAMCNTGINYMLCLEFGLALTHFEYLKKMLTILGISELPYHTQFGINSLIALCYFKAGQISKFLEKYSSVKSTLEDRSQRARLQNFLEEELIFKMLNGYYLFLIKNTDEAKRSFEEAERYLHANYPLIKYWAPFFYQQYVHILRTLGFFDEAAQLSEKSIAICNELNQPAMLPYFQKDSKAARDFRVIKSHRKVLDMEKVIEAAMVSHSLSELHKKVEELDFINSLQKTISDTENTEELASAVGRLITNKLNVDAFAFARVSENDNRVLYFKSWFEADRDMRDSFLILSSTFANKSSMIIAESSNEFAPFRDFGFSSVMSITMDSGKGWKIHLFCASNRGNAELSQNEFVILNISVRQVLTEMISLEQGEEIVNKNEMLQIANEQLYLRATTDSLTSLHNRQFIIQRIGEIHEKNRRKTPEQRERYTLIFLDLDNFKYFNDRFGHALGDVLLKEFGLILKHLIRSCDCAARFGGDEFIIFLPGTELSGAEVLASRIYKTLTERESFMPEIMRYAGDSVSISEDKRLSCSMGIAGNETDLEADSEKIIHLADMMLYRSKENGKNRYTIFSGSDVS